MLVAQGAVSETLIIVIKGEFVTEMSDEKGDYIKIEEIKGTQSVALAAGTLFASDNLSPGRSLRRCRKHGCNYP